MNTPRREERILNGLASPCFPIGVKRVAVGSPFGSHSPRPVGANAVSVNDDEAERKQRRLNSNMCTMMSPGCHTPRSAKTTNSRPHVVESSASALSNSQLAEHYTNCIKLSSQNKISSKNAFGLHLIDHMLKMLQQRGETTNFQVASSTLDASAKIYAGRVDSIYNDAFKILGGLGKESHADKEEAQEEDKDGDDGQVAKKKIRRGKKPGASVVIEGCPSALDITDFEMEFKSDPLFQKTAAAFDKGGVAGLLLNNISVRDDSCGLQLDSSQKLVLSDHPSEGGVMLHFDEGLFDLEALQSRQICPTFANFKFNASTSSDEEDACSFNSQGDGVSVSGGGQVADVTMLDAPPTSSEYACDHDDDIAGCGDEEGDNTTQLLQEELSVLSTCSDNQLTTALDGAKSEESAGSLHPGSGGLCLTDFIEPSDYSYFTPAVIASWAGPQHWKFRPRNVAAKMADEKPERKRKRVTPYKVDFTKIPNKSQLSSSKASTYMSKAVRSKLDSSLTTLPQDTHTNTDVLCRLFCKPKWKVKGHGKQSGVVDEILEGDWYNYGNNNDQLNYCPLVDDGDNNDTSVEESLGNFCDSQGDTLSETIFPLSMSMQPMMSQQEELAGENLISKPPQVEKVKINYATNAKKIDVKKLKTKMWEVISKPHQEETDDECSSKGQADAPDEGGQGVQFSSLYSKLPSLLSTSIANNMSVPICFVCLLHLANEKELKLSGKIDLSDFTILTSQ